MSKTREALHSELLQYCSNVYFQPPNGLTLKYPAIVYKLKDISKRPADDKIYSINKFYTLTIIDKNPDCELVDVLSNKVGYRFTGFYTYDRLNHFTFDVNI